MAIKVRHIPIILMISSRLVSPMYFPHGEITICTSLEGNLGWDKTQKNHPVVWVVEGYTGLYFPVIDMVWDYVMLNNRQESYKSTIKMECDKVFSCSFPLLNHEV